MLALGIPRTRQLFPRASAIVRKEEWEPRRKLSPDRADRCWSSPGAMTEVDNAYRVCRLGVARTLSRDQYTVEVPRPSATCSTNRPTSRASEVGRLVRCGAGHWPAKRSSRRSPSLDHQLNGNGWLESGSIVLLTASGLLTEILHPTHWP